MKIIIVEDEGITALFLEDVFQALGHEVVGMFDNGQDVIESLNPENTDVIFMDIQIKGPMDGIQLSQIIHRKVPDMKFVFLTSYKDSITINDAQGVQPIGYLIKPILKQDLEAILMVVQGQIKQQHKNDDALIQMGEYIYHTDTMSLKRGNTYVHLTKNEQLCFHELIKNREQHVSTQQLISVIWSTNEDLTASLRELTSRLRKKLRGLTLENIPNIGYILKVK